MCLDYDSYIACPLVVVFLIKSQSWLTFSIDSRLCEIVKFVLEMCLLGFLGSWFPSCVSLLVFPSSAHQHTCPVSASSALLDP